MKYLVLKFILFMLLVPQVCYGAASHSFDGTNDEIFDSAATGIDTDAMSICMWAKNPGFGTEDYLMLATDKSAGNGVYNSFTVSTGEFRVQYVHSGTNGEWRSDSNLTAGVWQNICITYNRSSLTNNPTFYFDASVITNTEAATPTGTPTTGLDVILIGENAAGADDYSGLKTYIELFSGTELNLVQVSELIWKPGSLGLSQQKLLVIADSLVDYSGTGNNLTSEGSTTSADGPPVMFGGGLPL